MYSKDKSGPKTEPQLITARLESKLFMDTKCLRSDIRSEPII